MNREREASQEPWAPLDQLELKVIKASQERKASQEWTDFLENPELLDLLARKASEVRKARREAVAARAGPPDGWALTVSVRTLAVGECFHERESQGYQPAPLLRHLVNIRQRTCGFPGCRNPAARCDQDHTIPHGQGGRTCECNLACLCRRHHQAKQAQGWWLDQPEPGVLIWRLPHGRSYRVDPRRYPA